MSMATRHPLQRTSAMSGQMIATQCGRLIVVALVAAFGYNLLTVASKSWCPGGVLPNGSFTDAAGNAIDSAPECVTLTLSSSWLVFAALAAIVLVALGRVRKADDDAAASKIFHRGSIAIVALAGASVVISQVWFGMIPITEWNGSESFVYPFPFGAVELSITPMTTP